jgi:hypothetical protein
MTLRDFLTVIAIMSLALITTLAKPLPALIDRNECANDPRRASVPARTVLLPAPPAVISQDKVLASVYYDALAILSTNNRCSEFFGNRAASMNVFHRFVSQVRKDYASSSLVMRMRGPTISGADASTNVRYRLFSKVSINVNGPFYRNGTSRSERTVLGIGSFAPNTREVRVLVLLHELGHLMQGPNGEWLLPDDGGDEALSRSNSRKVEEVCGEQIKGLGDPEVTRNLVMKNHYVEEVALGSNNPTIPTASSVEILQK